MLLTRYLLVSLKGEMIMVERLKRLYLEGRISDSGIRKAVSNGLITASDASYILLSKPNN